MCHCVCVVRKCANSLWPTIVQAPVRPDEDGHGGVSGGKTGHNRHKAQSIAKGGCSTVSKFRGTGMSVAFSYLFVIGNPFRAVKRAAKAMRGCVSFQPSTKLIYGGLLSRMCAYGLMNRATLITLQERCL